MARKGCKPTRTNKKMVKQIVKEQLKVKLERKYHDVDTAPSNVPNGGANFYLNAIAGGEGVNGRVGQIIRGVKLEVKGTFNETSGTLPVNVRMILFRDMDQDPGSLGTIGDLLETGIFRSNQQYDYNAHKRYNVLIDKRFTLDPSHENRQKNFSIQLNKTMVIHFAGNGAGSYQKGSLILGFVSDEVDINNPPVVQFTSRLWYTDA